MAILGMVLVLNSPNIIWSILIWIMNQFTKYKSKARKVIVTTWQTTHQYSPHVPTAFECTSEYIFFVMFTLACIMIKATLDITWLPISGLIWWYRFYRNLVDDASGRSLLMIFTDPAHKLPQSRDLTFKRWWANRYGKCDGKCADEFPAPLFQRLDLRTMHPRYYMKSFPGTKRSSSIPSCATPVDYRENRKKADYLDINLPSNPVTDIIDSWIAYIWNDHDNAEFYDAVNMILLSLWITIGFRLAKLVVTLIVSFFKRVKRLLWNSNIVHPTLNRWSYFRRRRHHSHGKRRRYKWKRVAFTSVYNVDDKVKTSSMNSIFDTDASFVVCDNSANTHICNDKNMFVTFKSTTSGMVATIGGKMNKPSGIGTVEWKWKDDEGASHTERLEDVLYFPTSPINIMSVTAFAEQLGDEEGTGIDTKMKYSRFYWKGNRFSRKIYHSASNLPELAINEGNVLFSWWTKMFNKRVDDTVQSTCCFTNH